MPSWPPRSVLLGLFVWHCLSSRTPLVHPDLFRSRPFTGASLVALFFSASFGAMLLSIVLWEQGAWGWSALRAGLAIAPGPLMVPVMSFLVAGRLIRRYGPAMVISLGSVFFAAGVAWWALAVTAAPNYLSGVLAGMILTGVGVGLTLPTVMATGASLAAPAGVRHRLGGHQHDPPDRPGSGRGRPDSGARHRGRRPQRPAGQLPARLVGVRSHLPGRRRPRCWSCCAGPAQSPSPFPPSLSRRSEQCSSSDSG